jgi:hypothetical protein
MVTTLSTTGLYNRLGITATQLSALCRRWQIAELALFGSILRDDFQDSSDVDMLVTYHPQAKRGLFEKMMLKAELEALTHRKVDLVSKTAIENSRNWVRRENILNTAEVIYVA